MNVLFVNYHDFSSNSAIHIFNFANQLIDMNVDCKVCVPRNKKTVSLIGKAKFDIFDFNDFRKNKIKFADGNGPHIIHAWTPREIVRKFTQTLKNHYNCKYIVHLEDNEEAILKSTYQLDAQLVNLLPAKIINRILDKQYSHPIKYKNFLCDSDGVTVIIEKLLQFKPNDVVGKVIWPGYEESLFNPIPPDLELKKKLGIPEGNFVVVYSGNVHNSNKKEVYNLYLAIAALNRKGIPVILVRTGRDFIDLYDDVLKGYKECFINLGLVEREVLPRIMSLSDVFVQPGTSDEFNDFRFPSKLPEFLAMGKPVILPNTNIGKYLTDGENCILLSNGDAIEISEKLEYVFSNKSECEIIGERGRRFAEQFLNWRKNTEMLYEFYCKVLDNNNIIGGNIKEYAITQRDMEQ